MAVLSWRCPTRDTLDVLHARMHEHCQCVLHDHAYTWDKKVRILAPLQPHLHVSKHHGRPYMHLTCTRVPCPPATQLGQGGYAFVYLAHEVPSASHQVVDSNARYAVKKVLTMLTAVGVHC